MSDLTITRPHSAGVHRADARKSPEARWVAIRKSVPQSVAMKSTGITRLEFTACFFKKSYTPSDSADSRINGNQPS